MSAFIDSDLVWFWNSFGATCNYAFSLLKSFTSKTGGIIVNRFDIGITNHVISNFNGFGRRMKKRPLMYRKSIVQLL